MKRNTIETLAKLYETHFRNKGDQECVVIHRIGRNLIVADGDDNIMNDGRQDGTYEDAVALVDALRALRIPTRLKTTKLVGCGVCDHYHPSDFNGECRDDGTRFPTLNDKLNGDPGTD